MNGKFVIAKNLNELKQYGFRRIACAIGVFDGIHLGHQAVFRELLSLAKKTNAAPVVITFHPHPRAILTPENAPSLLYPQKEKARLIQSCGADALVRLPFTKPFSELSPEAFLDQCLHADGIELTGITVGKHWRFGIRASGDETVLRKRAEKEGFLFCPVREIRYRDHIVSSTAIRAAMTEGDLDLVTAMLGRPYEIFGIVEHGLGLAAKTLGAATANIKPESGILPPFGVYASMAHAEGKIMPSITSVGIAPTIRNEANPEPKAEVHIFGFDGDLYGKEISVELIASIRKEKKFDSVEALRTEIHKNIAEAAELLKRR